MHSEFDYIIVGSGFGGSVMACRLVEKGYRVCLLERGRQWKMHEFPRRPQEIQKDMFWDPKDSQYGLMEFRDSAESDIMTLTASGLGGGSLIYANVLYRMPAEYIQDWPAGITREFLDPYYDRVQAMMEARPYPYKNEFYYSDTPKTKAFIEVAEQLEQDEDMLEKPKIQFPPLAVRFEGEFPGHQTRNMHGAIQSKCNKCGECDLGCNIHAKNSLDLNYIYRARNHVNPLDVRTHADVTKIEEHGDVYKVTYQLQGANKSEVVTLIARHVVVSAGSVGSTSLLLKMKQQGHLPRLNQWLGKKWSGNGDLLGFVADGKSGYEPTKGPVITAAIEHKYKSYPDGFKHGLYIEDAGFPIGVAWYLSGKVPQILTLRSSLKLVWHNLVRFLKKVLRVDNSNDEINLGDDFASAIDRGDFLRRAYVLLGMGRDRSDGEITLRDDGEAVLKWSLAASELHYSRVRKQMGRIAKALGGVFFDNPLTLLNKVIAVHPLGGCPMGDSPAQGFVSKRGEVFGHPGLYVVDGSIIPTSIGPNPSLTIAAMAEYIAEQIPAKGHVEQEKAETVMS